MIIQKHGQHNMMITCLDKAVLSNMQSVMDGSKVRGKPIIIIPIKSSPKILNFKEYGIQWGTDTQEIVAHIIHNAQKRREVIGKIKSQYGSEIKFGYQTKGQYEPLEHQKIMYNIIAHADVAGVLADPGTCKTGAYLWAIDTRIQRGQVKRALIVTLPTLKENVLEEMNVQTPHLKGVVLKTIAQSDKVLNNGYARACKNIDYDIYIANYESMFKLVNMFSDDFFQMVVLDEAHRIGSMQSRQTKCILNKFENTPYKYIVTGTLHANNLMSFFAPFRFLGADTLPYAKYYEFRKQHMFAVDDEKRIWKPFKWAELAVRKIVGDISAYFSKEECLNLPPVVYIKRMCVLGTQQGKVYNDMRQKLISIIDNMCEKCSCKNSCDMSCGDTVEAKNALVLSGKLRQIACGFYTNSTVTIDNDGKKHINRSIITMDENPKLQLLIQVLSDLPSHKKVIVWTDYVYTVEMIAKRISQAFGSRSCITCYQQQNAYQQVGEFKDGDAQFMIANPSKMGVGLNIQFSSYQVFFSNSHSFVHREQAIGRQHRQGQTDSVTVFDLIVKDTRDEDVLTSLSNKYDLSMSLSELSRVLKKQHIKE